MDNGNLTIVKYKRSISSTEWQNTTENFEKLRPVENGVSPLLLTCWRVDPAPSGESGDDLDWQDPTRSWSAKAFGLEPSVVKSVNRLAMWAVVLRRIVSNGPRELHYVVSSALQIHSITAPWLSPGTDNTPGKRSWKIPVLSLVPPIYSFHPLCAQIFRRKSEYVSVAMDSRTF
jgi:hypothetical protein